jgi:hypothetical protein
MHTCLCLLPRRKERDDLALPTKSDHRQGHYTLYISPRHVSYISASLSFLFTISYTSTIECLIMRRSKQPSLPAVRLSPLLHFQTQYFGDHSGEKIGVDTIVAFEDELHSVKFSA